MNTVVVLCISTGMFFLVVAAIGILRLPDVFARSHALGLTDSLGASLVLIGLAVHQGFTFTAGRTLVVLLLLFLMNPVISHATLRAAMRAGVTPWQRNQ
jgi:multicomponent Na+:H+ antiporter subunit G